MTPQDRLLALYAKATPDQKREGREWYPRAYIDCCGAGRAFVHTDRGEMAPWTPAECCAVAAAFSPRVAWEQALRKLRALRDTGVFAGHTRAICRTVERLVSTPREEWPSLCGPKVNAFREALLGDQSSAVCDVHMYRAMGYEPGAVPHERGAYHIVRAAERVCEPVAYFQATVWVVQRGRS